METKEAVNLYSKILTLAKNQSFCERSGMGLLPVDTRIKFLIECFSSRDITELYEKENPCSYDTC